MAYRRRSSRLRQYRRRRRRRPCRNLYTNSFWTSAADSSSVLATAGRRFYVCRRHRRRVPFSDVFTDANAKHVRPHPAGPPFGPAPPSGGGPVSGNRLAAVGRSTGTGGGESGEAVGHVFSRKTLPPAAPSSSTPRRRLYRELNGHVRAYIVLINLPAGRFKNIARRRVTVVTRVRAPPPESTCVRRLWPRGRRPVVARAVGWSGLVWSAAGKRP